MWKGAQWIGGWAARRCRRCYKTLVSVCSGQTRMTWVRTLGDLVAEGLDNGRWEGRALLPDVEELLDLFLFASMSKCS